MRRMRSLRLVVALTLSIVLAVAGCGSERPSAAEDSDGPEPSGSAAPTAPQTEWLAVLATAEDPNDLDALTQEVRAALGGALVVSSTDCYEGLPEDTGRGYVLGARGSDADATEGIAASTGHDVLVLAEVTYVCPV